MLTENVSFYYCIESEVSEIVAIDAYVLYKFKYIRNVVFASLIPCGTKSGIFRKSCVSTSAVDVIVTHVTVYAL